MLQLVEVDLQNFAFMWDVVYLCVWGGGGTLVYGHWLSSYILHVPGCPTAREHIEIIGLFSLTMQIK